VVVFVSFFNRDDERLADADSFAPDLWLDAEAGERLPSSSPLAQGRRVRRAEPGAADDERLARQPARRREAPPDAVAAAE
jgi:hypothetical protein